jgi:hypothetical protein
MVQPDPWSGSGQGALHKEWADVQIVAARARLLVAGAGFHGNVTTVEPG